MKKISIVVLSFLSLLSAVAQEDPSKAQYYIDGYYEMRNGQYILSDIKSRGITFNLPNSWTQGVDNEYDDQIKFVFPDAQTSYERGFNEKFKFWVWQDSQHRWLREKEVNDGSISHVTNKFTCIMLLIDCSRSIGTNFITVKQSAKQFINMLYRTPNHDNIHIGIIGFNTNNNNDGYSPEPLTQENYDKIINYIDNLGLANGTALYKAMDKAIDQIESHINAIEQKDPSFFENTEFESTHIVSFTDGIDNTSRLPGTQNLTADNSWENNPYYIHIVNKLNSVRVKGSLISSHLVVVNNDEIRGFERQYARLANGITSKNDSGVYQYYLVNDFSELGKEFSKIVDALTTRWHDLQLYIPQNRVGRVRWTLGPLEQAPVVKVKKETTKPYRSSFGVIVGNYFGLSSKTFLSKYFALQVDAGLKRRSVEYSYRSYAGYQHKTYMDNIWEADVNFMFEKSFSMSRIGSWNWFAGIGTSLGLTLSDCFKTGLNAIGGIEYIFSIAPVTLQVDARPGYGYMYKDESFFDWALTFSARWHF